MIMKLRVEKGRFRMRLWIPLFLVWLLALLFGLLVLPLLVVVWVVFVLTGRRIPLLQILEVFLELLGGLRETEVRVHRPAHAARVEISMF